MSEFAELTGARDWSTPMPWTGKPYVKTYWDWLRQCYRTDVCILIGAREEPLGKAWADRAENQGKGKAPDRERKDLSPQGHRAAVNSTHAHHGPKTGSATSDYGTVRAQIRAYLKEHGTATTQEIFGLFPGCNENSVRATLHNDKLVQRVGGGTGKGSGRQTEESRWRLKETVADGQR